MVRLPCRVIALSIGLVAGSVAGTGCRFDARVARADEGEAAPGFTLADAHGHPHTLDDLLAAGKPAIVVFYVGHW